MSLSKYVSEFAILALLLALFAGLYARADGPFELKEVSISYKSFFDKGHDPLITDNGLRGRALDKGIDLNMNTDVFHYLYWNNTVHSLTDRGVDGGSGQFRMVGWEFGFGVDVRKAASYLPITVGYYHYSQHCLDCTYPFHYPVKDAIELKLFLYEGKK